MPLPINLKRISDHCLLNNSRLLIVFFFISVSLFGQSYLPSSEFIVDSISIRGNSITDNDIILAELTFDRGDLVDSLVLEYNRKRIYSLQLFTSVEMLIFQKDSLNHLVIDVRESWYIYPIPFIDRNDKDWTKLSYGLDLKIFNFRGRNELLSGKVKLGYDPGYSLFYNIPYLFRDEKISLQTDFSYSTRKSKSDVADILYGESFKQEVFRAVVSVGKRISLFHRISLFGGFNYIETPRYVKGVNATSSNIDRYGFAGIRYNYDTRNLNIAPTDGIYFSTEYTHKGFGNSEVDYGIYNFDFREYRKISGIVHAKWRIALREAFGKSIPYYDISILGVDDRVRGHYNTKYEGNGLITTSLETYFNIIEEFPLEFRLPTVPRSLTRYKINFGFQFFMDAGISRPSGSSYDFNAMQRGYGFGITLAVLPYNIARAEIAFNEEGKSQIILDIGLSF